MHRAATVPGFYSKTFIPYKPTFGENFKQAAVKSIDVLNKNVILSNDVSKKRVNISKSGIFET